MGQVMASVSICNSDFCEWLKPQEDRSEILVEVNCCSGGGHLRTTWLEKALVQNPVLLPTPQLGE